MDGCVYVSQMLDYHNYSLYIVEVTAIFICIGGAEGARASRRERTVMTNSFNIIFKSKTTA